MVEREPYGSNVRAGERGGAWAGYRSVVRAARHGSTGGRGAVVAE